MHRQCLVHPLPLLRLLLLVCCPSAHSLPQLHALELLTVVVLVHPPLQHPAEVVAPDGRGYSFDYCARASSARRPLLPLLQAFHV
jgi:hypothetical protein